MVRRNFDSGSGRLLLTALVVSPTLVFAQPQGPVSGYLQSQGNSSDRITNRPIEKSPDQITTVSPLVISPMAPVPNVGKGATYFKPEELQAAAHQARQDMIDLHYTPCGPGIGEESREDLGEFSFGALYDTLRVRQQQLNRVADTANLATQEALTSRIAAARGEGPQEAVVSTELARQDAVRRYQGAQQAMLEAEYRVADLQDWVDTGGSPATGKAYVDERTRRRANNGGHAGVYVPDEFKDLRLSGVVSRQVTDRGEPGMRVSGRISNPRKSAIAVPPIWVSVEDQFGTALKSEQAEAPKGQKAIPAGGSLAFAYIFKPLPEKASHTVVTFAPMHHAPRLKPADAYCTGSVGAGSGGAGNPVPSHGQ